MNNLRKQITEVIYSKELKKPLQILEIEAIIKSQREELITEIEKKFGKHETFTGSLGYQGLIHGIKSFQTGEDIVRDEIINIIKKYMNNNFRQLGKNTKALLEFFFEGKKGKSIVFATPEGNFLSPKAVEQALKSQSEELIKRLEGEKIEQIIDELGRSNTKEANEKIGLFNQGIDKAIKIIKGTE